MKSSFLIKAALMASAVSLAVASLPASVAAQDYDQGGPPPGYNNGPPAGYNNGPPPGYNDQPPPDDRGQNGYDDNQQPPPNYPNEPPPPGYDAGPPTPQQQAQDQRYAQYAETWARDNCVRSGGNVAAGAIFGGAFGAIIGAIAGGPRHAGEGAAIGAGLGGVGGAAVGASEDGATSPGCPPGYVVRGGAPPFEYAVGPGFYYGAPAYYHPWVWYGDAWVFRPYPYHTWYYRHYWRGGPYRHGYYR